jgi:galactose-1-phosphate uridylyltransferase
MNTHPPHPSALCYPETPNLVRRHLRARLFATAHKSNPEELVVELEFLGSSFPIQQ